MNFPSRIFSAILIPFLVPQGQAQTPLTKKYILSEFIATEQKKLVGDSSVIYIDGQKTSTVNTLTGFNRKIVNFGSLAAFVPISMVFIDDSFTQKPDLYDGLDERSKVIYLLSLLKENQVKLATTSGIGFGDLDRDQQLVLNSIIPKRLSVERQEADKKEKRVVDKFTLTDAQRQKVRLKINKSVMFQMSLVNQPGTVCQSTSMDHTGLSETSGFFRVTDNQESGSDEIYGVKVRSIVPNKLKKSDLDYADPRLNLLLKFDAPTALLDVFAEFKKRTGISIYADPRVANRKLTFIGREVKMGELLPAIALALTGTYRRVGSDFILTSDITGLGTRKLRFDQWEADIQNQIQQMTKTWYKQIANGDSLKLLKANVSDPVRTDENLEAYLAKNDQGQERTQMKEDLISPSVQGVVKRFNDMYKTQEVSTKGIFAQNSLQFNLVMPTGQDILQPSGGLGPYSMIYQERGQDRFTKPIDGAKKWQLRGTSKAGLIVRSSNKDVLGRILTRAKSFGFREIWIDTDLADALQSTISRGKELGMQVRLAIRPWQNFDPNTESDRTLLGDTGKDIHEWMPKNGRLNPPIVAYDPSRAKFLPEDSLSPDNVPDRWRQIRPLIQVSGLAGVVVLDAQASGYEQKEGLEQAYLMGPSDLAPRAFGYSISMRSKFLRLHGVDPIDLVPLNLMSSVNTNPYYFTDMNLMGFPRTYGSSDGAEFIIEPFWGLWSKFRGKIMAGGLERVANYLLKDSKVPVWCDLLVGATNKAMGTRIPLFDFLKTKEFSFDRSGPGMPYGVTSPNVDAMRIVIDGDQDLMLNQFLSYYTSPTAPALEYPVCLDVSRLDEAGIEKFLTKWLDPKSP